MKPIIVYVDQGVDGLALKQTIKSLQAEVDLERHPIKRMDAAKIKSEDWTKEAALVLVPGGRDVFYHTALGREGTDKILGFVEEGGSYLGICAGAYFGCGEIEFEKGGKFEVCAKRSLSFFPGLARGPAYGLDKYSYENNTGVEAALISWNEETLFAYYNGGCFFEGAHEHGNVEVLSRYLHLDGQPASILKCPVGKGMAILSGIHLEYSTAYLPSSDPYIEKIHPLLHSSEEKRKKVFREILLQLGISLKN